MALKVTEMISPRRRVLLELDADSRGRIEIRAKGSMHCGDKPTGTHLGNI